jgi:hypothetical protein
MATFGYFLSSEEHPGTELVDAAARAEQASQLVTEEHEQGLPLGPDPVNRCRRVGVVAA